MKYIITESQYNKAIDMFLTYLFEPHEVKTSAEHPNSIFWVKDGITIAEIDIVTRQFWVNYDKWDTFDTMFSLEYDDAKLFIREWLEEHYKLGGLTPSSVGMFTSRNVWNKTTNWD